MVYLLFLRGDYKECLRKIEMNFRHKCNPFLLLIKALIVKQEGRLGECFEQLKGVYAQQGLERQTAAELFKAMFLLGKYRLCLDNMAQLGVQQDWVLLPPLFSNVSTCKDSVSSTWPTNKQLCSLSARPSNSLPTSPWPSR